MGGSVMERLIPESPWEKDHREAHERHVKEVYNPDDLKKPNPMDFIEAVAKVGKWDEQVELLKIRGYLQGVIKNGEDTP